MDAVQSQAGCDNNDESDDEDDEDEVASVDAESEASAIIDTVADEKPRYSADLVQVELERRFNKDIVSLGSIAVGFADAGRLINAVHVGHSDAWQLVVPDMAYGTQETVDYLHACAQQVHQQFPMVAPLRINHIGKKDGGYIRPHKSHQNGRDVDIGFFYKNNQNPGSGRRVNRIPHMDMGPNWAFVRSVMTQTDVQVLLVDRKVQQAMYDYAVSIGEDRAWLDTLFFSAGAPIQHARRHRDHFHVRFFSPRSQELGRRVQPILAQRPDENMMMHRVRSGDTLGALARKYGASVSGIQKRNGMRNSFLKMGRVLTIPLRGPCTQCPVPPPVIVPSRHVPPRGLLAVIPVSTEPARSNTTLSGNAIAKPMGLSAPLE